MATRLAWRAPKDYTPSSFDTLVLAINQRLDELTASATHAADSTSSASLPLVDRTINNLVIGRGNWFELTVTSADAGLTGLTGGEPGRLLVLKNASGSSHSLPLVNNSSASTDGNRFKTRNGADIAIPINGARALLYSGELRGWVPISEVP